MSRSRGAGHTVRSRLARFAAWWRRVVWENSERESSLFWRFLLVNIRSWETAIGSFRSDQMDMRAYALTFRTLLAVVPFLAVIFSIFQAFGGLEAGQRALQGAILENLAPGSASAAIGYIQTFVGRISAGAIGGVGIIFLFFTAISLLTFIEQSFNALWDVEKVRPFLSRFVTYWAMITVGPALFAMSFSMTSAVQSHVFVTRIIESSPEGAWLLGTTFRFVPWLFTWTGMTLLYWIVPNTSVNPRAAIGGGILAGTLWELGKHGFTWASANLFRYNAVYGSFGALPVFLLWLQVGWIIVLLGCKVTFALQYARALREQGSNENAGPAMHEFLAIRCMVEVARVYTYGQRPPTAGHLATALEAPIGLTKDVLNRLMETELILSVPDESGRPEVKHSLDADLGEGYLPARDASSVTLEQIIEVYRGDEVSTDFGGKDPATDFVRRILARSKQAASEVTGHMTLADAVREIESGKTQIRLPDASLHGD